MAAAHLIGTYGRSGRAPGCRPGDGHLRSALLRREQDALSIRALVCKRSTLCEWFCSASDQAPPCECEAKDPPRARGRVVCSTSSGSMRFTASCRRFHRDNASDCCVHVPLEFLAGLIQGESSRGRHVFPLRFQGSNRAVGGRAHSSTACHPSGNALGRASPTANSIGFGLDNVRPPRRSENHGS